MNYSLIVPHRGPEEVLQRLLATVPRRPDMEVIVVRDTEGRGAGWARNEGIRRAKGHWLLFADSDDTFSPALSGVLDDFALDRTTDIVLLNAISENENGETHPLPFTRYIEHADKGRLSMAVAKYATWTPWSRMVRRDLVVYGKVQFEEVPVGNDAMFVLQCTALARFVKVVPAICYFYYQPTAGSQTWAAYTNQTYTLRIRLRYKINELYKKVGYPFLWPITSKIPYKELSDGQRAELQEMQRQYGHTWVTELRARSLQLVGRLAGLL